jgi:hypothetical protein
MDRSALLSLAAMALVAIGLLAALAPALFMRSNAIDYLRTPRIRSRTSLAERGDAAGRCIRTDPPVVP